MKKIPSNIKYRGSNYGLIINGKYLDLKQANKFLKRIKKINVKSVKAIKRKIDPGKYVIYMKNTKGTTFKNQKARI